MNAVNILRSTAEIRTLILVQVQYVIDVEARLNFKSSTMASQDAPIANMMFATDVYQSIESKQRTELLQGKYPVKAKDTHLKFNF